MSSNFRPPDIQRLSLSPALRAGAKLSARSLQRLSVERPSSPTTQPFPASRTLVGRLPSALSHATRMSLAVGTGTFLLLRRSTSACGPLYSRPMQKNLNKRTLSHSRQARHRCELSRASSVCAGAPISIDKASLRAVFRGGSFVDGCGSAAQSVPWRCLRLFAAGGLLLAAMAKNSSRHTPRAYALARREAHAPRRGGGMCNDTARDAFRGPEIKLL